MSHLCVPWDIALLGLAVGMAVGYLFRIAFPGRGGR